MIFRNIRLKSQFRLIFIGLFILSSFILLIMFWVIYYSLHINSYLIQISQIQKQLSKTQQTIHSTYSLHKQSQQIITHIQRLKTKLFLPEIIAPFDIYQKKVKSELKNTHVELNKLENAYQYIHNTLTNHGAWKLSVETIQQILSHQAHQVPKKNKRVKNIQAILKKAQKSISNYESNSAIQQKLQQLLNQDIPFIPSDEYQKKQWILFSQIYPRLFSIHHGLKSLVLKRQEQLYQTDEYFKQNLTESYRKSSFLIFGLIAVIGITFLFAEQAIKWLFFDDITKISRTIWIFSKGQGDLTQSITLKKQGNNELRKLANYFNRFLKLIRNMVHQIHFIADETQAIHQRLEKNCQQSKNYLSRMTHISEGIHKNSTQLDKRVEQVYKNSRTMKQFISDSCQQIQSQTLSINESCEYTQQLSEQIHYLSKSSQDMLDTTTTLKYKTQQASTHIDQTEHIIEEIDHTSQLLQQTIEMISNIAEKTNLLSMNSSIEMANMHQRSSYSSFLAQEIHKLAENTQLYTQLVLKILTEAITKIHQSKETIQNITQLFKQIIDDIQIVANNFMQMNQTHCKMTTLSQQIQHNFNALTQISKEVSQSSTQMMEQIQYINQSMAQVQTTSEDNRLGIQKLLTLIHQLNQNIILTSSEVNNNTQHLTQLNTLVKQLKTNKDIRKDVAS